MKLSDLINQAQVILDRRGDIEVFIETPDDEHDVDTLDSFECKNVTPSRWFCAIRAEGCSE